MTGSYYITCLIPHEAQEQLQFSIDQFARIGLVVRSTDIRLSVKLISHCLAIASFERTANSITISLLHWEVNNKNPFFVGSNCFLSPSAL